MVKLGPRTGVSYGDKVYEYVDDVPAALLELGRVLRPGGRALVLDTDWDSIVWASSNHEPWTGCSPPGRSTSLTLTCRVAHTAAARATAWAQDLTELGPNYFFSLNRYLFLAVK